MEGQLLPGIRLAFSSRKFYNTRGSVGVSITKILPLTMLLNIMAVASNTVARQGKEMQN